MKYQSSKFIMLLNATRYSDWRYSFIPLIFGNIYLWLYLFNIEPNHSSIVLLISSFATSIGFAALGYYINEYFDIDDDFNAGKMNKLVLLSRTQKMLVLLGIILITFLPWIKLPKNACSILLVCIQVLLFLSYSSPPLRLKKHWLWATILDANYAYVLPFLLGVYTYALFSFNVDLYIYVTISIYSITLLIAGVRNITIHHINDIFTDKRLNIITLPRYLGVSKVNLLLKFCIISELSLLLILCSILVLKSYVFLLGIISLLIQGYKFLKGLVYTKNKIIVNRPIRHITDELFQLYLPAIFLLNLIVFNPIWGILAIPHIIIFIPIGFYKPLGSWMVRAKIYLTRTSIIMRHILSLIVNYSIFFIFLLFGVNLIKQKKSAWTFLKHKLGFLPAL